MNLRSEGPRSSLATFQYALTCVGFMVAVSAMIVTSIPWTICGLAIMAVGFAYFLRNVMTTKTK